MMLLMLCLSAVSCGGDGGGDGGSTDGGSTDGGSGDGGEGDKPELNADPDIAGMGAGVVNGTVSDKNGYSITASSNSANYTEITEDGSIFVNKSGTAAAQTVKLAPPVRDGKWFAFGSNFSIGELDGSDDAFEILIGKMYALKVRKVAGSYVLFDYNSDRYENLIAEIGGVNSVFSIYVEFTLGDKNEYDADGNVISTEMKAFVYINGDLAAESSNYYSELELERASFGDVTITIARDTEIDFFMKDLTYKQMKERAFTETSENKLSRADKYTDFYQRERLWSLVIGEKGAKALRESSERLFGEDIYEWLAALYDPASGVFYYSNSARDNFGYLPSIDNLGQGVNILFSLGLGASGPEMLSPEHKARVAAWAGLYHSGRDGYFYHPQWGSGASDSRRGRDLTSLIALFTNYGEGRFLFSDANYRLSGGTQGNVGTVKPITYLLSGASPAEAASRVLNSAVTASKVKSVAHLDSPSALESYLDGLWTRYNGDSYQAGSTVASQAGEIRAAGLSETCINWLNAKQKSVQDSLAAEGKPYNGIWEKQINYRTISGLLKISGIYNTLGYEFLYPDAALSSTIQVMTRDIEDYDPDTSGIVYVYNPPRAIENILINQKSFGKDDSLSLRISSILRESSEDIILVTEKKLMLYKKPDGSFSYYPTHSSETSQNSPAAVPGTNEGDVNATSLAFGTRTALFSIFGLALTPVLSPNPADALFDLDGDGVNETVGHLARFNALIAEIKNVDKTDPRYLLGTYNFAAGETPPRDDAGYSKNGSITVKDGVLTVTDSNASGGYVVYFDAGIADSDKSAVYFSGNMRYTAKPTVTTPHQLFMDTMLKIDFKWRNGALTFVNRYKLSDTGSTEYDEQLTDIATGKAIYLDPTVFFDYSFEVYPDGITYNGEAYSARASFTQNGTTYTAYLKHARSEDISSLSFTHSRIFSLSSTVGSLEFKNVRSKSTVLIDGDYTFDRSNERPAGITGGELIIGDNNALGLGSGETLGAAVAAKLGKYQMNEAELDMLLSSGGAAKLSLLDKAGKCITALTVEEKDGTLTVKHSVSGQTLLEVKADLAERITLRLEYHYDMAKPTVYLHLRYLDSDSGLMRCDAAELVGVTPADTGASAADYATLELHSVKGAITVDNLLARSFKK